MSFKATGIHCFNQSQGMKKTTAPNQFFYTLYRYPRHQGFFQHRRSQNYADGRWWKVKDNWNSVNVQTIPKLWNTKHAAQADSVTGEIKADQSPQFLKTHRRSHWEDDPHCIRIPNLGTLIYLFIVTAMISRERTSIGLPFWPVSQKRHALCPLEAAVLLIEWSVSTQKNPV